MYLKMYVHACAHTYAKDKYTKHYIYIYMQRLQRWLSGAKAFVTRQPEFDTIGSHDTERKVPNIYAMAHKYFASTMNQINLKK